MLVKHAMTKTGAGYIPSADDSFIPAKRTPAPALIDKKKWYKKHPLIAALAALGTIGTGAWGIHHILTKDSTNK